MLQCQMARAISTEGQETQVSAPTLKAPFSVPQTREFRMSEQKRITRRRFLVLAGGTLGAGALCCAGIGVASTRKSNTDLVETEVVNTHNREEAPVQNRMTIEARCHNCPMRLRAQAKPESLPARLWRWHTNWCPGWNSYVDELQKKGLEVPQVRRHRWASQGSRVA
jgi:hypothetical protein